MFWVSNQFSDFKKNIQEYVLGLCANSNYYNFTSMGWGVVSKKNIRNTEKHNINSDLLNCIRVDVNQTFNTW